MKLSAQRIVLQLEGLVALASASFAYGKLGAPWSHFVLLFFAPDLSMFGYLGGPVIGARCYNLAHTYLTPALMFTAGYLSGSQSMMQLSIIWTAHIGFDRALGYGLKYTSGFRDTHLQRV